MPDAPRRRTLASRDELTRSVATTARPQELIAKPMAVLDSTATDSAAARVTSRDWSAVLQHLADPANTGLHAHGQMTDARAGEISVFAHLTTLKLDGSNHFTDTGVRFLAQLPNLTHLDLHVHSLCPRSITLPK